jgi:hypothetical protein
MNAVIASVTRRMLRDRAHRLTDGNDDRGGPGQ